MWRDNLDPAPGSGDAMQLADETHHIGKMLDDMAANDFVKLIIFKRVRQGSEIVNHISLRAGIRIDTDSAGEFVLTATDVKNFS